MSFLAAVWLFVNVPGPVQEVGNCYFSLFLCLLFLLYAFH